MILRPTRILIALLALILVAAVTYVVYDQKEAPVETATLPQPPATFTPTPKTPDMQAPTATPVRIVAPSPTATVAPIASKAQATPTATATTPPATPTPTAIPTPHITISADLVNVRTGPGVNYPIVTRVQKGESFDILARSNDQPAWYEICCVGDSQTAWVRSDLVESNVVVEKIALATDIPTPPPAPTPAPVAAQAAPVGPAPQAAAEFIAPPPPPPAAGPPAVDPYTGIPGGHLDRRPVFVCINNTSIARPYQYGLSQADIVYEYVMEGRAVTRYTALFWSQDVPRIGPIRSARLINIQLPALYQAALLCSGASDDVRYTLKNQVHFPYLDIDLDDPSNSVYSTNILGLSKYDWETRLHTSSTKLEKYVVDWGVNRIPNTRGLLFGDYGGGTAATRVDIPYPSQSKTAWVWNGGQWARLDPKGAPYLDVGSGQQITADNVVIQWAPHQATDIVEDSLGNTSIRIILVGSGPVKILRDGKIIDGTWRVDDPNQPPQFFDANGSPIPLHPGRTWFEIVEPHYQVAVQ